MLVSDVPLNALALGRVLDEEPEPDALHAALHDVPAPDKHAELYREGRVGIVGRVGGVGPKEKGAQIRAPFSRSVDL